MARCQAMGSQVLSMASARQARLAALPREEPAATQEGFIVSAAFAVCPWKDDASGAEK